MAMIALTTLQIKMIADITIVPLSKLRLIAALHAVVLMEIILQTTTVIVKMMLHGPMLTVTVAHGTTTMLILVEIMMMALAMVLKMPAALVKVNNLDHLLQVILMDVLMITQLLISMVTLVNGTLITLILAETTMVMVL